MRVSIRDKPERFADNYGGVTNPARIWASSRSPTRGGESYSRIGTTNVATPNGSTGSSK